MPEGFTHTWTQVVVAEVFKHDTMGRILAGKISVFFPKQGVDTGTCSVDPLSSLYAGRAAAACVSAFLILATPINIAPSPANHVDKCTAVVVVE
jgi:hypothetical protein